VGQKPDWNGKELVFYVDNEVRSVDDLENFWLQELAYVKAYPELWVDDSRFMRFKSGYTGFTLVSPGGSAGSGGLKIPEMEDPSVIALFTRKGADVRTAWKGLNTVWVKGYARDVPWSGGHPMGTALYWAPSMTGSEVHIRFENNGAAAFRVRIEGVGDNGQVIRFETVIGG
jgi:hypothetical protein